MGSTAGSVLTASGNAVTNAQCTHQPEISHSSRVLAQRALEKLQQDLPVGTKLSHVDMLLWRKQQSMLKKEEDRRRELKERNRECTFQPNSTSRVGNGGWGGLNGN